MSEEWTRLKARYQSGRLPHGLLFAGPGDIGKHDLALRFANFLLCRDEENKPCGVCAGCQLCEAGTHPDLLEVTLEDSRQLKVEQVRELIEWSMQTANQGGQKIAIIDPAHAMNVQSANALLKVLEEPPSNTTIILISSEPMSLLATIRSRCQRINLQVPSNEIASGWLEANSDLNADVAVLLNMAEGRPLKALAITEDDLKLRQVIGKALGPVLSGATSPVNFASVLAGEDLNKVLELLYQLLSDSISHSLAGGAIAYKNNDLTAHLERLEAASSVAARTALMDRVVSARRVSMGTSNANTTMLLEWIFMAEDGARLSTGL